MPTPSSEKPKPFILGGREFSFVKDRRNGTRIFCAPDGKSYLRVGPKNEIANEIHFHEQLIEQGYPVPSIMQRGSIDEFENYFIESSAGDDKFGMIFRNEIIVGGKISSSSFDQFTNILKRYLDAEQNNLIDTQNWESLFLGAHFDYLLEEMPKEKSLIMESWNKIMVDLADAPFVLCHGDLNAHNILPRGIIDFETAFDGPLGYDLVSAVTSMQWFPKAGDFEVIGKYSFTDNQIETLWNLSPIVLKHFNALFVLRSAWLVVRMDRFPKLQAWRYKHFRSMMTAYLNDKSLMEWWKKMPTE